MRRVASLLLCTAMLAGALLLGHGASADDSVAGKLAKARRDRDAAVAAEQGAASRVASVLAQYQGVQLQVAQTTIDLLASYEAKQTLSYQLASAQGALDRRAAAAYEAGPELPLELFLGSETFADYASAEEFAAHTFQVDTGTIAQVTAARKALGALTARLERRQHDLAASEAWLEALSAEAAAQLEAARTQADQAGLAVTQLEKEQAALAAAEAAAAASLANLVDASRGLDQSALLALLGPTQGKGCDIPPGLKPTGQEVDGISSWYGWDFAGQHTASGAIFDPNLFTAANKELPLNVFLRIHYKDKCAIVLVNDRGPYGLGRTFDVAEAVAGYLGYQGAGVAYVTTDVLAPAG